MSWETLADLVAAGLEDLAVAHWEEAETDKADVPLAIDWQRARAWEKTGAHRCAGLRHGGELAGYAAFTISASLFHMTTLQAYGSIYVAPEHRGPASLKLIAWCERELAVLHVKRLFWAARNPGQCDLLGKLDYHRFETSYSKLLGGS